MNQTKPPLNKLLLNLSKPDHANTIAKPYLSINCPIVLKPSPASLLSLKD